MFWTLAYNEFQVCKRLSRTKFIIAVAIVISLWYFAVISLFHMQDSGVVPMYGILSPRYFLSIFGDSYLALFCLGVLLLAYDIHSRDENNRILGSLQTKPIGSLQFFAGRLCGIFLVMGLPMVFFLLTAVLYGYLTEVLSLPFGEPIEPWSVISFLVLDVFPNFFFFGSLVFFLAWFIKPRFVALFLGAFCLYGLLWVNSRLPLAIFKPLQTVTGNVIFPSEIIPNFLDVQVVLNRIALILMGIGFLSWLSVLYTRNTVSDVAQRVRGFYAFGGGILLLMGMLSSNYLEQQEIAGWKRFHDLHFEPTSFPDIHHLSGTVDLYPGRSIVLDLNLAVSVWDGYRGDFVLFSFNPNYRIKQISVAGETVKGHKFNNGLLKIPRHYFARSVDEMQIQATGRPKSEFAYLDSLDRVSNTFGPEAHQLRYLGTENYIFDSRFVALMPGIKWYPTSGTATKEDMSNKRKKDFFTVDLLVSAPSKWLVAGPAQRELTESKGRSIYQFQTHYAVPEVALIASKFERTARQIDGVQFELLYHRSHRRSLETLTEYEGPPQLFWFAGHIETLSAAGLNYPYSVHSLIEVPSSLRTFGGDSMLSPVLGVPGILMMPETTIPTMHLNSLLDVQDYKDSVYFEWTDRDWVETKLRALNNYFGVDLYAGNHYLHLFQSIVSDQIRATGPNATILNLVLTQLVQLIFLDREITVDFDIALDREVVDLVQVDLIQTLNVLRTIEIQPRQRVMDISRDDQVLDLLSTRNRKLTSDLVLDAVETLSLFEIGSRSMSTAERRALRMRALAVSNVILDVWGVDATKALLVELLQNFRGQNFTYIDFISVAQSQGIDFKPRLNDMMHSSGLPGFITADVTQSLVQVDDLEHPLFHTTFTLQNGEPVSGYCLVTPIHSLGSRNLTDLVEKSPVFVDRNQTLEVVIQSKAPIYYIEIKPYLSLNRSKYQFVVPAVPDLPDEKFETPDRTAPAVVVLREIEKNLVDNAPFIVIDDLDSGFSVVDASNRFKVEPIVLFARRFLGISDSEMIRGLPAFQFEYVAVPHDTWERKTEPTAYGKYWKTYTVNRRGGGETFATYVATLPTRGSWRLEYFLPERYFSRVRKHAKYTSIVNDYPLGGVAKIDVHVDDFVVTKSMDTNNFESGWHFIGNYMVENPEVEVWISNPNSGGVVFADAIRWSPAEGN